MNRPYLVSCFIPRDRNRLEEKHRKALSCLRSKTRPLLSRWQHSFWR